MEKQSAMRVVSLISQANPFWTLHLAEQGELSWPLFWPKSHDYLPATSISPQMVKQVVIRLAAVLHLNPGMGVQFLKQPYSGLPLKLRLRSQV